MHTSEAASDCSALGKSRQRILFKSLSSAFLKKQIKMFNFLKADQESSKWPIESVCVYEREREREREGVRKRVR